MERTTRAGRRVDAALHLLDRQLIAADGRHAGKVDDLELREPEDGGAPYVTTILSGPGALSARLGGRLGAWVASVHQRLREKPVDAPPAQIAFGVVKRVNKDVELSVAPDQLDSYAGERWAQKVISHIPGARHAPE